MTDNDTQNFLSVMPENPYPYYLFLIFMTDMTDK